MSNPRRHTLTRAIALFALVAVGIFTVLRPSCDGWTAAFLHGTPTHATSIANLDGQAAESDSYNHDLECCQLLEVPSAAFQAVAAPTEDHFKLALFPVFLQFGAAKHTFVTARNAAAYHPPLSSTPLYLQSSRLLI